MLSGQKEGKEVGEFEERKQNLWLKNRLLGVRAKK